MDNGIQKGIRRFLAKPDRWGAPSCRTQLAWACMHRNRPPDCCCLGCREPETVSSDQSGPAPQQWQQVAPPAPSRLFGLLQPVTLVASCSAGTASEGPQPRSALGSGAIRPKQPRLLVSGHSEQRPRSEPSAPSSSAAAATKLLAPERRASPDDATAELPGAAGSMLACPLCGEVLPLQELQLHVDAELAWLEAGGSSTGCMQQRTTSGAAASTAAGPPAGEYGAAGSGRTAPYGGPVQLSQLQQQRGRQAKRAPASGAAQPQRAKRRGHVGSLRQPAQHLLQLGGDRRNREEDRPPRPLSTDFDHHDDGRGWMVRARHGGGGGGRAKCMRLHA